MKEKAITASIITFLRSSPRGWAEKTHGSAFSAGEPDIKACVGGRAIFLEVKQPGLQPTKLQEAKLLRWRIAGAVAEVVSSKEETKAVLEKHGVEFP